MKISTLTILLIAIHLDDTQLKGVAASSRRAFTVTRENPTNTVRNYGQDVVPFNVPMVLLKDTAYVLDYHMFACNLQGTYVFTFSVSKASSTEKLKVYLKKNLEEATIVSGLAQKKDANQQVAGMAVITLENKNLLYLTMSGRAHSSEYFDSSFSGFRLP